jgi:hypothetical protein
MYGAIVVVDVVLLGIPVEMPAGLVGDDVILLTGEDREDVEFAAAKDDVADGLEESAGTELHSDMPVVTVI